MKKNKSITINRKAKSEKYSMKHTTDQILNLLRAQKEFFKKEYGVKKIGIFGSYARGESYEGSDIDIVVELEKPDMFYLIGVKQTMEDVLDSKVDVVRIRDKMNKALRQRIERDAIYV